jgi:hypothetical protein
MMRDGFHRPGSPNMTTAEPPNWNMAVSAPRVNGISTEWIWTNSDRHDPISTGDETYGVGSTTRKRQAGVTEFQALPAGSALKQFHRRTTSGFETRSGSAGHARQRQSRGRWNGNSLAWAAVGAAAGVVMCSATFWMSIRRQITEAKREASAAGPPGVQANQD